MWPVMTRGAGVRRELDAVLAQALMSSSVSQIGISIATVTLSLASMKRCSVSWRSLLLPTAGMMSAAVSVAAFSLRLMMMRKDRRMPVAPAMRELSDRRRGERGRADRWSGRFRGSRDGAKRWCCRRVAVRKIELRPMVGEAVDLTVIELD